MPAVIENIRHKAQIPYEVHTGMVDEPFTDAITKNGKPIEPAELVVVKFFMRPLLSRKPTTEATAEKIEPIDGEGNNVRYKWQLADVNIEGEFMAWWGFTNEKFGAVNRETAEFPILITDHGPGRGVQTGAILDGVGDHMPITFDALRKSPLFGDRRIQKLSTLVQIRVLKTFVSPDEEITAYELPLLDYFSKRVALELIRPGIDYWSRQHRSITAESPHETAQFPDMIAGLEKLRTRLVDELAENWRELQFLVPELKQRKAIPMPASSIEFEEWQELNGKLVRRTDGQLPFVTRNPASMQHLQTGWHGNYDLFSTGFFPLTFFPEFP